MWSPGSSKPDVDNASKRTAQQGVVGTDASSSTMNGGKPIPSPRKKLSGATMNMRFMKRKQETSSSSKIVEAVSSSPAASMTTTRKRSLAETTTTTTTTTTTNASTYNAATISTPQNDTVDMEINIAENVQNDKVHYTRATSTDMYGIGGSLIGRRSFRGFNPAMERAWKDSKSVMEDNGNYIDRPIQKISDEELLQRYQDIVQQRNDSGTGGKGIGNLDRKIQKRKRKRQELR